ncbi:hypothetical protein COB21_00430 [Candidatus Aerophobetes bacterium]|uniref:Uncharacterized protein n=1 Tax=Aerophobetes bacterium TaxID=2030807 RepID=A0A2A4X7I6_UNCAE|nr:MAG: hypothetical protein COB21_00430 [Candidatus Aerophobetes bacterium]
MKRFSGISILIIGMILATGAFGLNNQVELSHITRRKSYAYFEQRMVSLELPICKGPQRSFFDLRLRTLLGLAKNIYIEINDIFEDGPTGIAHFERYFYHTYATQYGINSWKWIKNIGIKTQVRGPYPTRFFHKKHFFLNAGLA